MVSALRDRGGCCRANPSQVSPGEAAALPLQHALVLYVLLSHHVINRLFEVVAAGVI